MVRSGGIALLMLAAFLLTGCAPRPSPPPPKGERIVSLAPNLTEIVFAIGAGAALVGRTSACDYPDELVKTVPIIGGFGAPNLDRLLQTKPTLILDIALEDETTAKLIAQLGIQRVRVPCATLDNIPAAILTVGRLTQAEPAARQLAGQIRDEVARLRAEREQQKAAGRLAPVVYAEIWGDPLMTVGRNSFVAELITLAGGRNLGDEVTARDYFPVANEWVIARNPDIILCLYMTEGGGREEKQTSNAQHPTSNVESKTKNEEQSALPLNALRSTLHGSAVHKRIAARTGWSQLNAVCAQRVYGAFDNNLILRPGPRVLEGIAALQECIEETEDKSLKNPYREF